MKILFIMLLISFSLFAQQKYFLIEKNNKGGFNIYSHSNELIYAYTKQNFDSASLETLGDIFFEAHKDISKQIAYVSIENWPEKDSFLKEFWKIFVPSILALIFGWMISFIPQKNQSTRTSFFQLLDNQNKILENISINIKIPGKSQNFKSRIFFGYLNEYMVLVYKYLEMKFADETQEKKEKFIKDGASMLSSNRIPISQILNLYRSKENRKECESELEFEKRISVYIFNFVFNIYQNELRNYFRHLFNIIRFIDETRFILGKDKLINFIQAGMSDAELFFLFYDGLKYSEMKTYIEKYKITRNLYKIDLLNPMHEQFYNVKLLDNKKQN